MASRVAAESTVQCRPTGPSMVPLIRSRQLVTVAPVDPAEVAGVVCLHLVTGVDVAGGRVQIGNNRGRINGWTSHGRVFGIDTAIDGTARPRTADRFAPDCLLALAGTLVAGHRTGRRRCAHQPDRPRALWKRRPAGG
ncbi:MAG: hypothetical protein QOJ50_1225 [Cryptosporangiaceae bacterium]|nr:hypothetical protein [Cryptosporangiaceae bacterium]